jgi:excinuclease ABC subunit C
VMRGAKRKGVRYFGPYSHAWAIRETLDLLLRVFPARTCSKGVYKRAQQVGRPCLFGYIDKCSAPCVGRVTTDEHREIVNDFCDFLAGQTGRFLRRLETEMREASDAQAYERAARLRDDIGALRRAIEKQAVVLSDATDADAVAFAQDELEAAVFVFHVRGGRVRGQRGYVVDRLEGESLPDLVESFLSQAYLVDGYEVPREVLVPAAPQEVEVVAELLTLQRGAKVEVRVPQRGDRRASDLSARSRALSELQESLGLADAPLRIECFDISSLQGTNVVASMVVFEDGVPRKSEYRRFAIRGTAGQAADDGTVEGGDVDWIHEVVRRRFARYLEETAAPAPDPAGVGEGEEVAPGPRKFAYPPNLVVVDGGFPQVNAGAAALEGLGIEDVAICGLAKRLEEVWVPGDPDPIILPRSSEGLYLLQRIRDEAHRFAITYHRQKRSKSMVESILDGVPGLGETRRKALLARFGSLKRLRAATVEEITEVSGIGPRTADAIVAALAARPAEPAVDPATGEVLSA